MEQETIAISKKYSHITGLKKRLLRRRLQGGREHGSTSYIVQDKEKEV
jgi:hypothetical protein